MALQCVACGQPATQDQPYYCQQCYIPIPPYDQDHYIGDEVAYCPNCEQQLSNRQNCNQCDWSSSFYDPPLPAELSREMQVREQNRQKLAKDVLADNRMTQQVIEMLGIEHLPRAQQGVALSALAREKMNFLSVEYNLTEAHTLVDMGHAIAEDTDEQWAIQLTSMRLAMIYYRKGMALQAVKLLTKIYKDAPQQTNIEQYRKLELLAHLALAHRLAGNAAMAEEIADQAHEQALQMYQNMEQDVNDMIKERASISQYMGLDEGGVSFPRVDYIFTIIVILAEEAIARGPTADLKIREAALDRLMELDNLIKILGNISPEDDTTYFSSQLRDYVRIFNGLLWYGDLLLPNAHTRRRYLVEQYYERIHQWSFLIPPQYWLTLRAARFLDIFLRAQLWAEFDATKLIDHLFENASDETKASWHYVLADAYSKVGKLDQAMEHLDIILNDSKPYMVHAEDDVRILAEQLFQSIQLEALGVLVGVTDDQADWIQLPLSIQLDEVSSYLEPESYLQSEVRPPLLRMSFSEPPEGSSIAVFGDKLLDQYEPYPAIRQVGDRHYTDEQWTSTGKQGIRTDVVVLRTELINQSLTLLFEGQPQEVADGQLQPSALLLLRGIIHQHPIDHDELLNILADLMAKTETVEEVTYLFTLKTNDNNREDS